VRDFLRNPKPDHRVAVFLDRDGTINEDTDYPHRIDELHFLPGALDALAALSHLPVATVIVTNQAGLALGLYSLEEMHAFNAALVARVDGAGGRIDAIYYCPHREGRDYPDGLPRCDCSKPRPGMLLEAAADLGLDLSSSLMIGDKKSDIAAGQRGGCRTILVLTGKAGQDDGLDVAPDFTTADLRDAIGLVTRLVSPAE
jgi:D-glycero-D-manno-heptose 1,7-bisphosphate phosphatase